MWAKPKRSSARKTIVKQLDRLFSQYIRLRDAATCRRCMKRFELWHDAKGVIKIPQGYHCAHIMSRVHYSTRWAEDNAIGLCYGCHAWFDREHQARWDFLKTRGYTDDSIDQLRYRSHQKFGGDYQLLELYLKQRLGQLLTRGAL